MYTEFTARGEKINPEALLSREFYEILSGDTVSDAIFADSSYTNVIGVAGLPLKAPVIMELLKNKSVASWIKSLIADNSSVLIIYRYAKGPEVHTKAARIKRRDIPIQLSIVIAKVLESSKEWAGYLNNEGEHISDLRFPSPGPHFHVNLLLGNRIGFQKVLQTTPKSVVDRLGRGSFRSHADTQVLATRWDLRAEENGFPANRQFYLVEGDKKIFYSASPNDSNIECAFCKHSQNYTEILYHTICGLEIKRLIFILPQKEGLPLATEVQRISVRNLGKKERNLRIVYTGMFGTAATHAIFEDVIYTNIIMQSKVLKNEDGSIAAVSAEYYPEKFREDIRFHTMMLDDGSKISFPTEYSGNYNNFVGNGTLEDPEGLYFLNNKLERKGPGFFALAAEFRVSPEQAVYSNNFTGIVSKKCNSSFDSNTLGIEIKNLINRFSHYGVLDKDFNEVKEFYKNFRGFIELKSEDKEMNSYVNRNLPFQVFYQTFISRAFGQTQKGYREIGFREIQDLFMSMYYFAGMGRVSFIKELLREWCSNIYEFGYANHNFYWIGKEPGKWSDDALWFIQAVYRYICLTGDVSFLNEECNMADGAGKTRRVFDTIKAVIRYSSEISIGKHGLPLLDFADWNDCLKLDMDYIDGIEKEKLYSKQQTEDGNKSGPLESDYSESIMNAFLLKLAVDNAKVMADMLEDRQCSAALTNLSHTLVDNINKHAWKENFFARVLFNRYHDIGIEYLGAKGDGFSPFNDKNSGTYFLNSFSWAILSDTASEEQIEIMLDTLVENLTTPYGLKLATPMDLSRITKEAATGHYFYGDRENGAVFKHASMMAAAAMFKAAKKVMSEELASRLSKVAYWAIDTVLPYKTMGSPFETCGNPRFCTQYNNSETGESIGPMLSGTATWLNLALMSAFGIEYQTNGIMLDPILRDEQASLNYRLKTSKAKYNISIRKPKGFTRIQDGKYILQIDGKEMQNNLIPVFDDNNVHFVELTLN
jgi:cellobiose phosphorylase